MGSTEQEGIPVPFDGTQIETPALRRAILVDALRQEMPDKFGWDFYTVYSETFCCSVGCALGLASLIWPDHAEILRNDFTGCEHEQGAFFGLSIEDANRIFWNETPRGRVFYRGGIPSANRVARALERAPLVVPV
jgi:hypothetical protein